MCSLVEFNELCKTETFSFFLNASQKYSNLNNNDGEKFKLLISNLNYLIKSHEFDFLNCITSVFEKDIKNYASKYSIDVEKHLLQSIKNITKLEYIDIIFSNAFFPTKDWILHTATAKFEDQELDEYLRLKIPHFSNVKHNEIISALIKADAQLHTSSHFSLFLLFYLKRLDIETLGFEQVKLKYELEELYHHLSEQNSVQILSIIFHYYHNQNNFSLFTYNLKEECLLIDKFLKLLTSNKSSHKNYDEASLHGEPSIRELKSLLLDNLFEKNSQLKEYSNFQLLLNLNLKKNSDLYFHITRDHSGKLIPFDFFVNNPHHKNSGESLLWQEHILSESLLARHFNSNQYIFEINFNAESLNNKEHFPFFNNLVTFFDNAIEQKPVTLQYIQAEHLDKILIASLSAIKQNFTVLPFFQSVFFSVLEFAQHYQIPLNIPKLTSIEFDSAQDFMIEMEKEILQFIIPVKQDESKLLKF